VTKTIAILGAGKTARALRSKLEALHLKEAPLENCDFIVTSPGIPACELPKTSKEIISEVELAFRIWKSRDTLPQLICVTGTNGKSTVTSLIAHMLEIPATGNIGDPLINYVGADHSRLAVELSSFQLEHCSQFRPQIAVLLPISPDHIQRHGTFEQYAAEKAKLIQNMGPEDTLIYEEADPILRKMVAKSVAQKRPYSLENYSTEHVAYSPLQGRHNDLNVIAATLAAETAGLALGKIQNRLKSFTPLQHRLESLGEINGALWINDSKATNPDATVQAVASFSRPIHLIMCGEDNATDLEPMLNQMAPKLKSLIGFGDLSDRLGKTIRRIQCQIPYSHCTDLNQAVAKSFMQIEPNDVVLFSPSSASYDQFVGFEARGKAFKDLVRDSSHVHDKN